MDTHATLQDPSQRRKRVLVVDDSSDTADAMALLIEQWGHDVAVAGDGLQALSTARDFQPDVCLLDLGLPEMDGYEVGERLRAEQGGTRPLRLVALSGYSQPRDRERTARIGFDAHLAKPVDLQVLAALIARESDPSPGSPTPLPPPSCD